MKTLLENILARLTTLDYLSWVGVLDHELLPPQTPAPPFVGVKDAGLIATSQPGKVDKEELRVHVVAYQSVMQDMPGASLMGEPALGNAGRGLFDIGEDLKAVLNDNLFGHTFHFAHRERVEASSTIVDQDGRYLQYQRQVYVYRRIK